MGKMKDHWRGFTPYALGALVIGLVGGFSAVLGPAFVADLGLGYENTTWTALAQAVSTAAWAPILGRLGEFLGRKRCLLLGMLVFTLGNGLTALAGSLSGMLLARFLVGLGTAAMAPVILSYILTEFPPEEQGRGFSVYMLLSSGAVVVGPILGSLILADRGWRRMVWLCTGISLAGLVGCGLTGRREPPPSREPAGFDCQGAAWVVVFFSLVLCLPTLGQNVGWGSRAFLWGLGGSAVSAVGLIRSQRRSPAPILPGNLLKSRGFVWSIIALFLTQGLMQADMTAALVFLRYTAPENAALSGVVVSLLYVGMALGAGFLGPLADRYPPKRILLLSLGLTALGCGGLLGIPIHRPGGRLMVCLGLLGLGLGGNGTVFLKTALEGVRPEDAAAGAGTFGLFRDLAAPFGVAVLVPLFTNRTAAALASGIPGPRAAGNALKVLALIQLFCVAAGMAAVGMLPNPKKEG